VEHFPDVNRLEELPISLDITATIATLVTSNIDISVPPSPESQYSSGVTPVCANAMTFPNQQDMSTPNTSSI